MPEQTNFSKCASVEELVTREKYYVLLLVDRSESMAWPYLKNLKNHEDKKSQDWKEAVKKVQDAISSAHARALVALRNSRVCKDRSLYVYQYLFNDEMIVINKPEKLAPFEVLGDGVIKLTQANYSPISTTALYNTIYEALIVMENDYLKESREKNSQIDQLIIGVITDGKDTVIKDYNEKSRIINQIKDVLKKLRNCDGTYTHLVSSVLIGLTSKHFTEETLKMVRDELSFDEAISIDQSDDGAIRKAFKLFSTDAANY